MALTSKTSNEQRWGEARQGQESREGMEGQTESKDATCGAWKQTKQGAQGAWRQGVGPIMGRPALARWWLD